MMATLDCSNQGLKKIELKEDRSDIVLAVFDNNDISRIENLESCKSLQQVGILCLLVERWSI